MQWYQVTNNKQHEYVYCQNERTLTTTLANQKILPTSYKKCTLPRLSYRLLLSLYEEIYSAMGSGLQLNEAILHLADACPNKKLALICRAISCELSRGEDFNQALTTLATINTQPFCQLISQSGTRETYLKSLSCTIDQLTDLIGWSQNLLKSLTYPFCIIQIAWLLSLLNDAFFSNSPLAMQETLIKVASYILISLIQAYVMINIHKGEACHWLEAYSREFRLAKLFILMTSHKKMGQTLQSTLESMPSYFQHRQIRQEVMLAYYKLRLGHDYTLSFSQDWFPGHASIALETASKDGNIDRALFLALQEHQKKWQQQLQLIEKLLPVICLIIASIFVIRVLLSLYQPLMDMPF
ncbi:type II secretion system F family protein [Marinomonas epiphytica]